VQEGACFRSCDANAVFREFNTFDFTRLHTRPTEGMTNKFMRKSHRRQEELAQLSLRAREAGLEPAAIDPSSQHPSPCPWQDEAAQYEPTEEEMWSQEEFWARLPPELNPATAKERPRAKLI
jgi:hypothetical protein